MSIQFNKQKETKIETKNITEISNQKQAFELFPNIPISNYENLCKKLDEVQNQDIIIQLPIKNKTILKYTQIRSYDNDQTLNCQNSPENEEIIPHSQGIINLNTIKNFNTLKKLYVEYCTQLQGLEEIKNFPEIVEINISNSDIVKFPMIKNLRNLQKITIQECRQFETFEGIESCNFDKVFISSQIKNQKYINEGFKQCLIIHLDKCDNFHSLGSIQKCAEIKEIEINCLNIKNMSYILNLDKLKKISINQCNSLNLFDGIKDCSVEEIILNRLSIKKFPITMNLIQLKKIYIQDCQQLLTIEEIKQCSYIEEITLSSLQIKSLPVLKNLISLKKIYIQDCQQLNTIEGIQQCQLIEDITLSRLGIIHFPTIQNMNMLKHIHIQNCEQLKTINGLKQYSITENTEAQKKNNQENANKLKIIIQGCGKIENFNVLEYSINLYYLDLQNTNISDISQIVNLEMLETLILTNNQQLPKVFQKQVRNSKLELQKLQKDWRKTQKYIDYKTQKCIKKQIQLYHQLGTMLIQAQQNIIQYKYNINEQIQKYNDYLVKAMEKIIELF